MNQLLKERIKYYESIGLECRYWDKDGKSNKKDSYGWHRVYFNARPSIVFITDKRLSGSRYYIENNKITRIPVDKIIVEVFEMRIKIVP